MNIIVYLREHQLYLGGSWINFETCTSDFDNCPLCDAGMRPSYVVAATIIDHSEYILKRGPNAGTVIKNAKRLAVFKSTARVKVLKQKDKKERGGDLTGCTFDLTRYKENECATGEEFEFVEKLSIEDLKKLAPEFVLGKNGREPVDPDEWIKPYNYAEVFKPKTAEQLTTLIGGKPAVGSDKDNAIPDSTGDNISKYLA